MTKVKVVIETPVEIVYHDHYCGDLNNPLACRHYDIDITMGYSFDGCGLFHKNLYGPKLERERCEECLRLTEKKERIG